MSRFLVSSLILAAAYFGLPIAHVDHLRRGEAVMKLTSIPGLEQPVAMAFGPRDGSVFVAERITGRIRLLKDGKAVASPVLDLGDEISRGGSQGLLGLAISRDGERIYANLTDPAGDTRVIEFGLDGERVIQSSRREILHVDQPFPTHNGGNLVIGPDGYLWVGLGDGGGQSDPFKNAQNLQSLLGKMLRIRVGPEEMPYGIPADNPFVGQADARPEIYAFGLRNPWRYSFDRITRDLWIADVGADRFEEIDYVPAGTGSGSNYGWPGFEGLRRTRTGQLRPGKPEDIVRPLSTYSLQRGGCAVIGGYVYRGFRIRRLYGTYLYSDFCDSRIRWITLVDGLVQEGTLPVKAAALVSFAEDPKGELYLMSQVDGLFRIDPA